MIDPVSRDDFQRLRLKREREVWPGSDLMGGGIPAFLGQVVSKPSKIDVGNFFMAQPASVVGEEVEGAVGIFTPFGSSTIPVYLVGPGKPSTGDYLVCRFVDNRWVAEKTSAGGGGGGGTGGIGFIPGCFCTAIPATLTMTSADPNCNFKMFQSCSIQYQPTPATFVPLNLGPNVFLSTQSFPDPLAEGSLFYYFLTCRLNQFTLTRLYPTSPYGAPYRDAILYSWFAGGSINTCSPFRLDVGSPFPGSDLTCSVQIDAA